MKSSSAMLEKISYRLFGACIFLFASLFVANSILAETSQPPAYSAADALDIKRVEEYLNNLKTLKARFLQVTSTGSYAEGELFISRPGKMRIEYKPPVPVLIIADGQWLIYNDKELEQVNYVDLKSTPAGVLVADNVSFTHGDYQVRKIHRRANTLRMLVTKKADKAEGAVTLIFSDSPLVLKKWAITDAQGVQTTISLLGTKFGIHLDSKLFEFDDQENEIFRDDS